jgi:hypothetical protein
MSVVVEEKLTHPAQKNKKRRDEGEIARRQGDIKDIDNKLF